MPVTLEKHGYQAVPREQWERLQTFRRHHPRTEITLAGATWSYLLGGGDAGSKTLLILPGGERKGDLAFPLMEHFESRYRCLYPAYPPCKTMASLVAGLVALLDRLAIERVDVFAASFGGDVGQCLVRAHPERVSSLILLNTGIPDVRLGKATQRGRALVALLPLPLLRVLIERLLHKLLSVQPAEASLWQAVLHELLGTLTRADLISSFENTIDYRLHYHFTPEDLADWPGKVLLLQSDDDPATTPAMRMALRRLYPQARVHTFHGAGHTPFLSQPAEFYPLVSAFLETT
jgi:maspardin